VLFRSWPLCAVVSLMLRTSIDGVVAGGGLDGHAVQRVFHARHDEAVSRLETFAYVGLVAVHGHDLHRARTQAAFLVRHPHYDVALQGMVRQYIDVLEYAAGNTGIDEGADPQWLFAPAVMDAVRILYPYDRVQHAGTGIQYTFGPAQVALPLLHGAADIAAQRNGRAAFHI